METTYLVILVLYMVGLLGMAWILRTRISTSADFYTAKHSMGSMVTGFSYAATQMSAGTAVGSPAQIYRLGYNFIPGSMASVAAPWFTFMLIGERIRRLTERIGVLTYGDMYERRYGRAARLVYALIICVFYVPLMVGQLKACGDILAVTLGLPYLSGMLISAAVVILYTILGGMYAVAWSDLVQGLIMMVGFVVLLVVSLNAAGGFAAVNRALYDINPQMVSVTGLVLPMWAIGNIFTWSFLQIGGAAHAVVRFIIPKDIQTLRRALGWAMLCSSVMFISVAIIGTAGRVLLPDLKYLDQLIPMMARTFLHPVFGGIMIAAVLAAIMSSVDSLLLLVASAAGHDIYSAMINPKATEAQRLRVGRIWALLFGLAAVLFAIRPFTAVQWLVAFAFNVGAASFTGPILAMVWGPGVTKSAGLWGMVSGAVTCLSWYYVGYAQYQSFSVWPLGIWPGLLGVVVSAIVMIVVSRFTQPIDQETRETFYAV